MKDIIFKNLTEEQINAIKVLLGDACEMEEQAIEETSFPKPGDEYYYILSDGEIDINIYSGSCISVDRISMGNCFRTKEEAEFEVERLKVIHEMKKFVEPEDYVWDGENYHYYIYYNICSNDIHYGNTYSYKKDTISFKSLDDAKTCVKAVGEDRIKKYYFRIKEGNEE